MRKSINTNIGIIGIERYIHCNEITGQLSEKDFN